MTLFSAPSSSRTFERICGYEEGDFSERLSDTASAFFKMIATRISCSGALLPQSGPTKIRD